MAAITSTGDEPSNSKYPRVLVVTNDFPPTVGGIQTYVRDYLNALIRDTNFPASNITVFASTQDISAAEKFDLGVPYTVVRLRRTIMLPTPDVVRQMKKLISDKGIDTVWFAAAAPLALMAKSAKKAGATRIVASTHGHEVGWSMFPGSRKVLRLIGDNVDTLTYVSRYVRNRIANAFGPTVAWEPMPGGVDPGTFHRDEEARQDIRKRYGVEKKKVIVAVSRIVPRKGQDTLVKAMPQILNRVPDAHLLIVGPGKYASKLQQQGEKLGIADSITITGAVDYEELPAHYSAGEVFALPVRTQAGGLSVEGLGIVFLESQASQVATIAGDGGGAPETIIDGVTGDIVNGKKLSDVAQITADLLNDEQRQQEYADAGLDRVNKAWRWSVLAKQLEYVLRGDTLPTNQPPPRHSWNYPVENQ